jgi:hypothetical protein
MIKLSISLLKFVWYVNSIFIGAIAFAFYTEGKISNYTLLIALALLFAGEWAMGKIISKTKVS